ncbi:MAG: hypothetical protein R3E58_01340 [Phycisphaerae bacterium]
MAETWSFLIRARRGGAIRRPLVGDATMDGFQSAAPGRGGRASGSVIVSSSVSVFQSCARPWRAM